MPEVIGVRFKPCGKIYDFEADGVDVNEGDLVVVDSELGLNIGSVIIGRYTVEDYKRELKKIIRKVTEEDIQQKQENRKLEIEARDYCLERVMARGLPMKLVSTEVTLDRKRFIFYFTAERRIDFRELVKDLAAKFKTRIEMRQIGVRDEAKLIGGLGLCGRELCCSRFLTSFEPVSIKMAKRQELVLNTDKLSGVCGRLMCCLGYEYDKITREEVTIQEEETISISEEVEAFEPVVASVDTHGAGEGEGQERKEQKEEYSKKFIKYGKKRRRRSPKK
ncbi:MAG: hypothetical protein FJ241_04235 [Nitrospira sp.]|nr:hypothetical protein [Nitrospira sp.]